MHGQSSIRRQPGGVSERKLVVVSREVDAHLGAARLHLVLQQAAPQLLRLLLTQLDLPGLTIVGAAALGDDARLLAASWANQLGRIGHQSTTTLLALPRPLLLECCCWCHLLGTILKGACLLGIDGGHGAVGVQTLRLSGSVRCHWVLHATVQMLHRWRLLLTADGGPTAHAHVGVLSHEALRLLEAMLGSVPVMGREGALRVLARDRWSQVRVEARGPVSLARYRGAASRSLGRMPCRRRAV